MSEGDFESLHEGEYSILEVHRYRPFVFAIVGVWVLAELLVMGAFYAISANYNSSGVGYLYLGFLALTILIIVIGYAFVQTYLRNQLIITNQRIISTIQHGLLGQHIAQCSLEFIQDVSTDHQNVMAALLDYGDLSLETSGNLGTFSFSACPHPRRVAALIVRLCRERKLEIGAPQQTPTLPAGPVSLDADFELPKPPREYSSHQVI